jgi:hypothetical protein
MHAGILHGGKHPAFVLEIHFVKAKSGNAVSGIGCLSKPQERNGAA